MRKLIMLGEISRIVIIPKQKEANQLSNNSSVYDSKKSKFFCLEKFQSPKIIPDRFRGMRTIQDFVLLHKHSYSVIF